MKFLLIILVISILGFLVFTLNGKGNSPKNAKGKSTPIKPKRPLTMNEQPTYSRLVENLPNCFVLAQVSLQAILSTSGQATRNRFNRKIADFVVCDKAWNVLAVVELDDSSHKGKEAADAERDAIISEAGYKVIRYARTPSAEQIANDFNPLLSADAVLNNAVSGKPADRIKISN